MYKDVEKILYSKEEIAKRVNELGKQITKDFKGEKITLVCILRGSVVFFADLLREINLDVDIDFISVSSYGSGTTTSGEVNLIKDLGAPIKDKNIILVEDIIDTGTTLSYLKRILAARNPKTIKICSILDKPSRRKLELHGDYVGFTIPDEFVVGYGLDYDQKYRNIPEVCILKKYVYTK